MDVELKRRFGTLVAAHRKRRSMTQQDLADATEPSLSVNMIGRIETGRTGASFKTIVNLARALKVDEAEFFATDLPQGSLRSPKLSAIAVRLSHLSDNEMDWVSRLIDLALERR